MLNVELTQKIMEIGAQILRGLNVKNLDLITNSKTVNESVISAYGLKINSLVEYIVG